MHSVPAKTRLTAKPRGLALSADVLAFYTGLTDVLMLLLPAAVIYGGYVGWSASSYPTYFAIAGAVSLAAVTSFYLSDLYRLSAIAKPAAYMPKIIWILAMVLLVFIGFLFALKLSAELSRVWVFTWFAASTMTILLGRLAVSYFFVKAARAGTLSCNIVVVGGAEHGKHLIEQLTSGNNPWNKIVGVFDDRLERVGPEVAGCRVLGNLEALLHYARDNRCDEIVVALPWSAEQRVLDIVNRLRVLPVHVSLGLHLPGFQMLPTSFRECAGIPVLEMLRRPIAGGHAMIKRTEDFLIGGILTLLALPLMLVIAILIKLDSRGPVLFRQPRYGFNNQLIGVYKFRTMYADKTDEKGSHLTAANDPRITRIGRFLRRSSLDELPQFFNVLKGEMSVVGPRPHAIEAKAGSRLYQDVVEEYAARHRVRPGITGWAQINGWRGETRRDEQILQRVNHDLYYIENWSLFLDLKIILRTFKTILRAQNAM